MEGWHGCGSGGDSYDPGRISELAPRRGGARRARPLLRRATLGGRDARRAPVRERRRAAGDRGAGLVGARASRLARGVRRTRSEEHTSELQSRVDLVCRLLLEKKKKKTPKDENRRNI